MKQFVYFALLLFVFACSSQSDKPNTTITKPQIIAKVLEVILIDPNTRSFGLDNWLPVFFVVETQNISLDTLTLCKLELQGNQKGVFLSKGFYDEEKFKFLGYHEYDKTVVIPPFRKQIDTVIVNKHRDSYAMESQMFWMNKFKNKSSLLLYLPRPAPYYQDTIFYFLDKNARYSIRNY